MLPQLTCESKGAGRFAAFQNAFSETFPPVSKPATTSREFFQDKMQVQQTVSQGAIILQISKEMVRDARKRLMLNTNKLKRILLPPLAPLGFLFAGCLWVYVGEKISGPRMIDGQVDNDPLRAAVLIVVFSPLFYLVSMSLNWASMIIDKVVPRLPWLSSLFITSIVALLFFKGLYNPELNGISSIGEIALMAFISAIVAIVPMTLWRKFLLNNGSAEHYSSNKK